MKIRVEKLSLRELTALNARVTAALVTAKSREAAELRKEFEDMAASRGFRLGDVIEFQAGKPRKTSNAILWVDSKTKVEWRGRGRYPQGFHKDQAERVV